MKILHLNSFAGIGSVGKIIVDIHSSLLEQGHESLIIYGRKTFKKIENSLRINNNFSVYKDVLFSRLFDNQGFNSKGSTLKLIKIINQYQPDLIHIHNLHGYYINIDLLFKNIKLRNIPVIWTLHDAWAITGHGAYFSDDKITSQGYFKSHYKDYPKSIFIDKQSLNFKKKQQILSNVKNLTIVTPSNWLQNFVERTYLSKYKIKTIYNGINLNVFQFRVSDFRENHSLIGKKVFLGVASVWEPRKGFDDFIKISNCLNEDEMIVLVGNVPQKTNLPDNILVVPRTNNQIELAEIYSASDVFLNPTYFDNYPTTNLESLACGTPVVTYNTGGSPESINDKNGKVVAQGDFMEMLRAAREFSFKKHRVLKKDCFELDKDILFNGYFDLYNQIVSEKIDEKS